MTVLAPDEAYRLWAPRYAEETVISALDEELAQDLSPSPQGLALLDAGCGIGRRLAGCGAKLAVGIDASLEMLAAGGIAGTAAADVRALPFADKAFDLVWCRLVLGHLARPEAAYRELARLCRPGGRLLVSDFHADAVAAGHSRSFRDGAGTVHAVEHHMHNADAHIRMAADAGFVLAARRDGRIGPSVERFYTKAGRRDRYLRDQGLAVVCAFLFRRACAS